MVMGPEVRSLHVGVDKRRFERVMANLLENAANYGGGATVISVTTVGPDGSTVSANGEGKGEGKGESKGEGKSDKVERADGSEKADKTEKADRPEKADKTGRTHHNTSTVVEIAVEDAGPGISAIERTKVFDRFYRGSAAGRRGTGTGTGLGLALVAEHMRLMDGETWVESSPSGGARFVISLPVLEGDEGPVW